MRRLTALLAALLLLAFTGCAANPAQPESTSSPAQADETQADFQVESAYPLEYAKEFTVDECTGGTRLITIQNARYLVVPGKQYRAERSFGRHHHFAETA